MSRNVSEYLKSWEISSFPTMGTTWGSKFFPCIRTINTSDWSWIAVTLPHDIEIWRFLLVGAISKALSEHWRRRLYFRCFLLVINLAKRFQLNIEVGLDRRRKTIWKNKLYHSGQMCLTYFDKIHWTSASFFAW